MRFVLEPENTEEPSLRAIMMFAFSNLSEFSCIK